MCINLCHEPIPSRKRRSFLTLSCHVAAPLCVHAAGECHELFVVRACHKFNCPFIGKPRPQYIKGMSGYPSCGANTKSPLKSNSASPSRIASTTLQLFDVPTYGTYMLLVGGPHTWLSLEECLIRQSNGSQKTLVLLLLITYNCKTDSQSDQRAELMWHCRRHECRRRRCCVAALPMTPLQGYCFLGRRQLW